MNPFFENWGFRILNVVLQGGLALCVALLIALYVPRLPASVKVWTLRLAFLKLLIAGLVTGGYVLANVPPSKNLPPKSETFFASLTATLLPIAFGLWVLSVGIGLGRHFRSKRRLTEIVHESDRIERSGIRDLYHKLCLQFDVRKAPALLSNPDVASPLLIKNGTTSIALPAFLLEDDNEERLKVAIAHELAHYRHRDLKWGWLMAAADLLFFFHPLVKTGIKKLRLFEEYAADAAAMKATQSGPSAYSRTLLSFAEASIGAPGVYAMADGARELDRRIKQVYINDKPRSRPQVAFAVLALLMGAFVLMPWSIQAKSLKAKSLPPGVFAPIAEKL